MNDHYYNFYSTWWFLFFFGTIVGKISFTFSQSMSYSNNKKKVANDAPNENSVGDEVPEKNYTALVICNNLFLWAYSAISRIWIEDFVKESPSPDFSSWFFENKDLNVRILSQSYKNHKIHSANKKWGLLPWPRFLARVHWTKVNHNPSFVVRLNKLRPINQSFDHR